jgi:hypothetical protein
MIDLHAKQFIIMLTASCWHRLQMSTSQARTQADMSAPVQHPDGGFKAKDGLGQQLRHMLCHPLAGLQLQAPPLLRPCKLLQPDLQAISRNEPQGIALDLSLDIHDVAVSAHLAPCEQQQPEGVSLQGSCLKDWVDQIGVPGLRCTHGRTSQSGHGICHKFDAFSMHAHVTHRVVEAP